MGNDEFFFSGEVAAALGVSSVTLRQWRDRGYCDYGYTELVNGEENVRARRRYEASEVSKMAVALALNAKGFGLEDTFRTADRHDVGMALSFVDEDSEDMFLLLVGVFGEGARIEVRADAVVRRYELGDRINEAFNAGDVLDGRRHEFVDIVNLSAIVRRTRAALAALD